MDNDRSKILICYHNEDNDGVFSCALLYNYFKDELHFKHEDIVLFGLDYNSSKSINRTTIKEWHNEYNHLIITDFSLPIKLMEYAHKLWGKQFMWFDHHRPVIEASYNSKNYLSECEGVRQTDRSAILCVWKYLYDQFDIDKNENKENIPELLRILSAWDSFSFEYEGYELDYVKSVNMGVTHLVNLDVYTAAHYISNIDRDSTLSDLMRHAEDVGEILYADERNRMNAIVTKSGDKEWKVIDINGDIRTACAIFVTGPSNSQMFSSLLGEIENGIVFKRNSNGTWAVSIYNISNDDTWHCGSFCREKYKGGGHLGAAGFQVKQSKMISMLRKKTI